MTSHQTFAVAFEWPVTDYLVKPVEYSRFLQAVQWVRGRHEPLRTARSHCRPQRGYTAFLPVTSNTKVLSGFIEAA